MRHCEEYANDSAFLASVERARPPSAQLENPPGALCDGFLFNCRAQTDLILCN